MARARSLHRTLLLIITTLVVIGGLCATAAPPPSVQGQKGATHWAYVKPQRAETPTVRDEAWPRNAIDRFVLARLEAEGLHHAPPAQKAKLLRRLYLDLIGLPPSPAEVDAFVNDTSPRAYEKVVDQLLASPRYGEKWARLWLDLARYADSNGYQADQLRDSWPYRDWVIHALNSDMPFDRFTVEQIAGDLLPNATIDQKIATGFHRTVTCNVEAGVDPEGNRVNQVMDRVATTGTVWLGISLQCAQCHDHKYDPFTMRDYYSLFAYFNNTPLEVKPTDNNMVGYDFYGPTMPVPLSAEQEAMRAKLQAKLDAIARQRESLREKALADLDQLQRAASTQKRGPQWHLMEVTDFVSQGGATHTVLDDQSVLVGGERPDKDAYEVTLRTNTANITGFRLETLTHESLPASGPGRHAAPNPNFVVYEMTASVRDDDSGQLTPIKLHSAEADFSQERWPVSGLIDGKADTGWAINPEFGKPHEATCLTDKPVNSEGRTITLVFTFDQHYGECRTIGRLRLSAMTGKREGEGVPDDIAKILSTAVAKRNAKQKRRLEDYLVSQLPEAQQLEQEADEIKKELDDIKPTTTLVMVEMDKPRESHVLTRGNWQDPAEAVTPRPPASLNPPSEGSPDNRLGLARWLVSPDNPLVARVAVNRWWAEFFGRGIVRTEEDFGRQGEAPTHPKLLDWLAVEFVEHGWSMKHIHKLIVMSATYQQDSRITPQSLERDPQNALLSRGPRLRLSAEQVRDNALAISGLLVSKLGGPPVYPPQPTGIWRHVGRNAPKWDTARDDDRFRRGVYIVWRRSAPYPSMVNFDAPDRAACVVQRSRTNTPLQALTLMNDPAYVEMAMAMAGRIMAESPKADAASRIAYAFRLAVAREPTADEAKQVREMYEREAARFKADRAAAASLISGIDGWKPPANLDKDDLAAWFMVANVLLNLDETITKG